MRIEVMERLLHALFRRFWLHIIPLAICCAFGAVVLFTQEKQYVSQGVLSASPDTLLGNLSSLGQDNSFNFDTPAAVTSRRINELMRSDEFVDAVATRAGLRSALESGLIDLDYVRQRVGVAPDGVNLLTVGAMTSDPDLSVRLATATIDSFIQSVIDEDLSNSSTAQSFYAGIGLDYLADSDAAQTALDDYLVAHPMPAFGARPPLEQSAITQLEAELARTQSLYSSAIAKVEDANLATELARLEITQQLRVLDSPARPGAPISGLKAAVLSMGIFVALGTILSATAVVLTAFLDKTVSTPSQIESTFSLDVLATVPLADLSGLIREH